MMLTDSEWQTMEFLNSIRFKINKEVMHSLACKGLVHWATGHPEIAFDGPVITDRGLQVLRQNHRFDNPGQL